MILMEKNGQKKFVFDCCIPRYRADGWKADGEADNAHASPDAPPEQTVDETAVTDGTAEETDVPPEQTVDETAVTDGTAEETDVPPEQTVDETVMQTFTCPHCGKEYSKRASLKAHIRRSHAEK